MKQVLISRRRRAVVSVLVILLFYSCTHFQKNASHQKIADASIARGKEMAAQYCQSCHLLPDPALLDASSWENGVLPAMGPRLGIFSYGYTQYPSSKKDKNVDKNYYPEKPVMRLEDWHAIMDYYTALSPDTLPVQERSIPVSTGNGIFQVRAPLPGSRLPNTCYIKIDTVHQTRQLVLADVVNRNLYWLNSELLMKDSFTTSSPVVDMVLQNTSLISCSIGNINPNDAKLGSISIINQAANGKRWTDTSIVLDKLARPVQISTADFNGDGKMDFLVCEFGNLSGALSWLEDKGNKQYERHVIRAFPGAIKAWISDVNKDGLPDIWVLFAQGEEGIFLFTNKGAGKFEQEEVLRFPPVFGSSYFEMPDFNKDGFPDILYTCGDNADFSPVLKPYHGIYIYLNDGHNHFTQKYFFPMHGCFKAMAADFDGDGDLDIAAISFFADYEHHPDQGFIYLQNEGSFHFKPFTIAGTEKGRWLTMDTGDLDGDGKTDIVLGNFSIAPSKGKTKVDWKLGPPFLFLKNITGK